MCCVCRPPAMRYVSGRERRIEGWARREEGQAAPGGRGRDRSLTSPLRTGQRLKLLLQGIRPKSRCVLPPQDPPGPSGGLSQGPSELRRLLRHNRDLPQREHRGNQNRNETMGDGGGPGEVGSRGNLYVITHVRRSSRPSSSPAACLHPCWVDHPQEPSFSTQARLTAPAVMLVASQPTSTSSRLRISKLGFIADY